MTRKTFRYLLLALSMTFAAAACTHGEEPALMPFINGGYSEPGQPGVVLIEHTYGYMCTGTLIAPKIVVTAKHCVRDLDSGFNYPVSGFRIHVGPSMYNIVYSTRVSSVRTYPGNTIEDQDIALLTLTEGVPSNIATPYSYVVSATGEHALSIGQTQLTIIGYGESICGQTNHAGVKLRTEDTFIGWVTANGDFATQGRGANHGDSGGPIFTPELKLIGVTSRGSDDCTGEYAGITIGTFIPAHLDIIREVMQAAGYCAPVANEDECGNGVDDDCNGYVDDACSNEGDPCDFDWECKNGVCLQQGTDKRCMKSCDPMQLMNSCGAGFYCRVIGCGQAICSPGGPGVKAFGDPCNSDTECETAFCRLAADGVKRCLSPCRPGSDDCLADEVCASAAETCGACNPEFLTPAGGRNLGEPCETAAQCTSGNCFIMGQHGYCTVACSDTQPCGQSYHCVFGTCVRGEPGEDGDPCAVDADCAGGRKCVDFGGGFLHCATPCADGGTCPVDGSVCTMDMSGGQFCKLAGGRALGDRCSSRDTCIAGLSCQDAGGGDFRCMSQCSRYDNICPSYHNCVMHGRLAYCTPMDGGRKSSKKGGCQAAPAGDGENRYFLLLLPALLWLGRRRPRPS